MNTRLTSRIALGAVAATLALAATPASAQFGGLGGLGGLGGMLTRKVDPAVAAQAAAKAAAEAAARAQQVAQAAKVPPSPEAVEFAASRPEALRPLFQTLYMGGERNAVLNFDRLGLAAMQAGEWKIAEKAFDGALMRIEQVYSKNTQAEQAKSVWKKEARKDFKGEPYERAMAYYYRGLLYLRAEDYDNARASFKSALFQDSINLDGDRGQDFTLMNYLAGWSSACAGDNSDADEQFGYAAKNNVKLGRTTGANTLFVAELGRGPIKAKSGQNAEVLEFQSITDQPETSVTFAVPAVGKSPAAELTGLEAGNIAYQATERDGRKMDGVLKGKANTKAVTGAIGDAMINNSMNNSSGGGFGALGFGLAMKLASGAMKADADTRMWETLPARVFVAASPGGPVAAKAKVSFLDGRNAPMDLKSAVAHTFTGKRCSLVWARTRDALAVDAATPGDDAGVASANSRRKDVQIKDKAFRETLSNF